MCRRSTNAVLKRAALAVFTLSYIISPSSVLLGVCIIEWEMDLAKNKESEITKTTAKPMPSVLSINICDSIIRDEFTKKVSLIGLFNTIRASSFPCTHPQLHVYVALTNGHGKYKTEIRFLNLEEGKLVAGMVGPLEFQNPLHVIEVNLCWQQLRFEKAGDYVVEVLCDGSQIGTRKFRVIGPQQEMPVTDGTEVR